ncbi:MAG TPA: DUF362 domain-containing protein [Methanothrix sp.]|nr:DUF362 domain-containing protein [Methanothrix sp.]HPJ83324.1 DUF362 domain-containing protein [Methanothrix sp.]HPR65556.1 DUF362 domain-containing protein [Methanothrix sp.]
MSFLIDPPLLVLSGLFIYFGGRRLGWNRHAKIVVGVAIILIFIIFSSLLYADVFRCVFPFFSGLSGSEFMLHSNITGITKEMVPTFVVVLLFVLYPVWLFAGYAAALLISKRRLVSKEVYSLWDVKSRSERGPSEYAVARDPDAKKCVREAVAALGGIERFVKPGDKVFIKINVCGGVPEVAGTFTSTEVVDEIVDLVRGAGGDPFIGDADMIWNKFWQVAADSGWVAWAKEKGVRLVNLSETKIVGFDFGEESIIGTDSASKEVIDAKVIISVPTMKTHLLTGVTLGMKNMYGTFPEVDKAKYHKMKIEEVIYEINRAFNPNLVIIDGSIGNEAIGPLSSRPIDFQTIVASNDVVCADSIASQLMGYDPEEVVHLKLAAERGLGDASMKFDFDDLPYRHASGKDGNWDRPEAKVKDFYNWGIELILKFPGWSTLFNVGADFFLYDMARLPVFKYLTPALLKLLNDVVYLHLRGQGDTEKDRARRRTNFFILLLLAEAALLGFYMDGYLLRSFFFDLNFILAIIVSILAAIRMKTRDLLALVLSSAAVMFVVETGITSDGIVKYAGSDGPTLFVASGWALLMVAIFGLSDLLRQWLARLRIFDTLSGWRALPFAAIVAAFSLFFYLEGYFDLAGNWVLVMYAFMALLGLFSSNRCPINWNAALVTVSVALGGYMELVGMFGGIWSYSLTEGLPIFITLATAINAGAVQGISFLAGVDLSTSTAGSTAEDRAIEPFETGSQG